MRHFHPPIHAAVVAVTVVAGLASYQGVDKLVLAKGGVTYGSTSEPGHETSPSTTSTTKPHTSTTEHHETGSTTTSTTPHTSTTEHHETGSSTSTTVHHEEPRPTASTTSSIPTTGHHEPTPTTTTPKPTTVPPGVELLTLKCGSAVLSDGRAGASCAWTQSTAPNFYLYRVTRELVGTPRQVVFTTQDRTHNHFGDVGLTPGSQYSYIVEAYDAAGNLVGHSGPLHINCCDGTVVST